MDLFVDLMAVNMAVHMVVIISRVVFLEKIPRWTDAGAHLLTVYESSVYRVDSIFRSYMMIPDGLAS